MDTPPVNIKYIRRLRITLSNFYYDKEIYNQTFDLPMKHAQHGNSGLCIQNGQEGNMSDKWSITTLLKNSNSRWVIQKGATEVRTATFNMVSNSL